MSRTPRVSKQDVVEEIQRLTEKLDRAPYAWEMERHGRYSMAVCYYRFGSWPEALAAAGVEEKYAEPQPGQRQSSLTR